MNVETTKSFAAELNKTIVANLFNNYTDNHDIYRFGPAKREKEPFSFKTLLRKQLNQKGYYSIDSQIDSAQKRLDNFKSNIEYFEYLYNLLDDDYSRDLLIKVCAYRILGKTKIKLPMNNPDFWNKIAYIETSLADKSNAIQSGFLGDWKLYLHKLNSIGYPIDIYMRPAGIYYDFIYKCYFYKQDSIDIKVEEGDYVIDAGGCFGDTALFFASHAGKNGKVYSFEFVPGNVEILTKNLELNPKLKKGIELIQQPLWSKPGVPVYYESNGPGTKASMAKISDKSSIVSTTTIDALVEDGKIQKVDFIKMDIEGAETNSLIGAEKTIRKFKPKLAISLYHSPKDFKLIPEFIKSLNLGYKFYFNHYTMHAEESVLFCTIK